MNQWKEDKKQNAEMPFHIFFDKNTGQVLDLLLCSNMWTVDDVGMLFFSKDMGPQYVLNVLHLYMVVEFISLVTSFMHFIYNELLKIFRFHTVSFVCFHTFNILLLVCLGTFSSFRFSCYNFILVIYYWTTLGEP